MNALTIDGDVVSAASDAETEPYWTIINHCEPYLQRQVWFILLADERGRAGKTVVNSFSTRLLSSCTDKYAHTYDISTYSVSSDRVSKG